MKMLFFLILTACANGHSQLQERVIIWQNTLAFFPLVGLVIGAMIVGLNWLIDSWLSRPQTAALIIVALASVAGARHLGGLTGDIVGCINEISEIAALIVLPGGQQL